MLAAAISVCTKALGFAKPRKLVEATTVVKSKPFAQAGDVVTCENGHEICEVAVDLRRGDIMRSTAFKNWRMGLEANAKPCVLVPPCPECGARFIGRPGANGLKIFIDGGWRP